MTVLSERIRARRIQLNITQEDLARRVNKSQKQIWQYESGRVEPAAGALIAFANALETTTDYLLGRTDYPGQFVTQIADLDAVEIEALNLIRAQSPDQREKLLNAIRALA